MANNSNRIIDRYKSYITKSQRKKLHGMYPGYRQTTADELREQYLDNRRSMGRTGAVASAYGLGEGYIARKQADLDRVTDRYALQLGQQADSSFEKQVVNAANQTIDARNKAAQAAYRKKLENAIKKQKENEAAYQDYLKDMEAYKKALAAYNKHQKQSKGALRSGGAAKSINTANALEAWDAAHGEYYDPRFGRAGVYGSSGNVYSMPKAATPRNAWYEYYDPRFGRTGNYGSPDYGSAAPKQEDVVKRKKQAVMGTVTKPVFTVNPKVKMPVEPKMQKFIDAQVAEIEANPPAEIEKLKLNLTQEYERATSEYKDVLDATQFEASYGAQAQQLMTRYKELEQMATDTRYTPEQRRDYARTMQGIQQQYAQLTSYFKANVPHIHRSMEDLNRRYSELQVKRGVLAALGVTLDDQTLALNGSWLRQGNAIPTVQDRRFWEHAQDVSVAFDDNGKIASVIYNKPGTKEWFDENGYADFIKNITDSYTLSPEETGGKDNIKTLSELADYNDAIKSNPEAAKEYLRRREYQSVLQEARMHPNEFREAVAAGEAKTGLSKGLEYGRKHIANHEMTAADIVASPFGMDKKSYFTSSLEKKLDLPKGYLSGNIYKVMTDEDIAFINYCYGTGNEQAAKEYLYELTEWGNSVAAEKRASRIAGNENAPEAIKAIREFLWQTGFGAGSLSTNVQDIFAREARPTSEAEATASRITQNKVERGWSPFWASTVDSAAQSFGNNAASALVGAAFGGAGSKLASVTMGLSAAGQAKMETLRQGYGDGAATVYGILNGVSEAVLQEKVGGLVGFGDRGVFTKVFANAVNTIDSPVLRTLLNQGLDILSEIGEEEFGNIVDNINRSVALGEKRGLFDGFAEQAGETAVSTAISTILLNALHIPAQIRSERGYSTIANASGMSLKDAKFLLETQDDITNGKSVDPKDLSRYNELTAVLTAAMPDDVAKAIESGKMNAVDWLTSEEGIVSGKLSGKLTEADTKTEAAKNPVAGAEIKAVDHTEALKGKTDEQRRDYLLNAAPTGKVGNAYYTTADGKAIQFRNLNTTQKANYVLAQKCAKAFEGSVDVVIHDTLPLSNGAMVGSDGKLHIALDVTNEQGRESIAYWTLAHEAGHALKIADGKAWNEMFDVLTDYAKKFKDRDGKNLYDALVDSITNQYKYDNDSDAFRDEMFSLIAERMVGSEGEQWAATLGDNTIFDAIAADKNASAKAKRGFLGKLKTSVEKLSRQLRDGGFSKERKRLAKIREQLTEAYKRINEGETVREKYAEQKGKGKTSEKVSAAEVGVNIDGASESANPTMMSLRTWNNSEYVKQRDKTAEEMAKELGISVAKAKAYIDDVNGIAKIIAEDQTRLDYEAAEGLSPFVSNAEYGGSLDFSTICKKRRLMTGTISAIQKVLRNSTLTRDEILDIRNMMKERGYEVSCGLCYVEGSRAKMGEFCAEFIKLFKKHNPDAEWVPDMYDVNTPDGAEQMRIEHPDVYKQYEYFWNHYGTLQKGDPYLFASQQKPKLFQKSTEYTNEILVKFRESRKDNKVAEKNKNGGLRLQSFSDFEIIHLLDAMQAITDMSRVGLAGQAYTKVPDFAWALGDTGVKINLSLISKGVDENGHIILDEVEGMPRKDAEALRNRYSDNVGTILVVFNDEQLNAAMADDFIDFIIPFHASQWNSNLYEAMGLPEGTKDYTKYQNEKLIKQTYHEYQGRQVKDKATNFMPNEYWDFDKTGKENAEAYLKLCAENNKVPKFSNLLVDNGDGSWSLQPDGSTDGYWKLLIDFKMYNNDGKGVPQMPVQPNFNMEEAQRMLNEYKGGHENFPVAQDVVDDFIKTRDEPAIRHSLRAADTEYLSLAEKYRDGTATEEEKGRLRLYLDMAAYGAGYKERVYHGTNKFGFTKIDVSKSDDKISFFAAASPELASTYQRGLTDIATDEVREIGKKNTSTASLEQRIIDSLMPTVNGLKDEVDYFIEYAKSAGLSLIDYAYELVDKINNATTLKELKDLPRIANEFEGTYLVDGSLTHREENEFERVERGVRGIGQALREAILFVEDDEKNERGTYEFYANTSGLLEIDCDGANWDEIPLGEIEAEYSEWIRRAADIGSTRSISQYAKHAGYKGVVFYNVVDSAIDNDAEPGDVYAFFKPAEQLKSADPVTYDDNGDIIPLSQRFNAENEDIRYQKRNVDVDFNSKQDVDAEIDKLMDKIRDIQNAKLQADEAAKKDPRVQKAQQKMWAAEDAGGRVGSVRERMEYKRILKQVKDEQAATIPEGDLNELSQRVQELKQLREQFLKVVPISAEQYDELANYFGTTKDYNVAGFILPDGRMLDFSGKKQYGKDYAGGREVYHNEVGEVLELNEDTSPRINMVANGNIRLVPEINGINLSQKPSAEQLPALRGFIRYHNGDVRVDIDNAAGRTIETFGYYKGTSEAKIISDINNYFETGEAPAPQSDLAAFRYQQRDFRIDFNVPQLDTKALHEAVKGGEGTVENRFDVKYEKTDSGFAVHITDRDSGKTYDRAETAPEGSAKAEAERAAAAVIRNIKRNEKRREFREYADKREADVRLAERMHEGAIRARIERKANETEAEYKARIKKIYEDRYRRETKNTALKWNKKLVDMLARPTENKHVPVQLARSVAEFCEEVTKYLDGTTKRGEKILGKISKAYDRAFTNEQTILRAKSEDAGYDARGTVLNTSQKDEQLAEMLKELSEITAEKSFTELTRDEMDALLNVVRGVAFTVTDANKMIGEAEGKTVWQTGSTMIEQLENAPKVSTKLRGYLVTSLDLRRLARIFSGSNENAEFVKLVEQLNQGAIEKERVAQELQSIFKPVTDEYGNEIKKWYGKKAEWLDTGIVTKDGVPVKITKGMRVSLALHVLNEGNMRHIERGGLTIPEAKLYAQGKLADAYANGKLVRLTAEQINDIIANMTEAEKAYVEAAKQLFHDRAGFYVNKTSLQLAGYTKANVENYFPIHTDKNFNKTDFASMSMDGSIEGQGFLKERVAASNPVYLEDITSVVNRQIRGVALYAGMAIPVRNFNAVMNAAAYEDEYGNWVPRTTVKQTLAKTMGEYGAKVVEGFVEDASEMSQRVDVTPVERVAGNLATNYVKAVLLGNLKVAMKQVASYPTAAAVIPWKYLNKALVAGGRNHRIISRADVDLINKYTPLYQMRREGNANEVASLMNKPGMEQKLPWLLGWITKMDVMTVGRLWSAAEYMVEDTHKDLTKGSDEFYREVAKVFNQTIQQTQPNFTPLQRNAALRSKNPIVRSLTLFGTQRMQNGGIMIEAAYELKHSKGKSAEEIAAARRKLGRAVASQVVQNFLLLAATLAVDALRGRMKQWQDDDDELTPESIASKMGDTFLSNFLGSFLGGSEFYETISNMYKKANGQTTYDTEFSVPALDAIETIMSFGQSGIPNFINYLNGDHTDEEKLNKLKSFSMEMAKVAGYATGLPLENAVKDVFKGFIPAYKDIRDWKKTGELIPYLWQSGKLDSAKTRERYEAWLDAGHKGSEFFAIDKKLKGVTKRDDRADILWSDDSLAPEDKAMLMEMYDGSNGGYANGSKFFNKNDKELYDFAAEPKQESETPAETPAGEIAEIPAATETPAVTEASAATSAPKSDKYTKAAEKWSPYGVTAAQAKTAVEKWEQIGNASEYRAWLSKQNYTGRQKFAMYAQANADTEKKAVDFNKKYGTKFEALWNAYTKYDSNSFHGEEYRAWVEKQTSDYRQRFSLVEFAEPRSNWIEHAEELHKAGVSYKAVWEAARYAKNQSGTGKKDRIIAYAKKLGMSTKQAENIYKWFG